MIGDSSNRQVTEIDLVAKVSKASYKRELISEQLYTGHMRIDLGRPMSKGNFILLKGSSNKGKTTLAQSAIKQFLKESSEHRAIYVGLTANSGQRLFQSLPPDCIDRAMSIGVDTTALFPSSDADFLLAPYAALRVAS